LRKNGYAEILSRTRDSKVRTYRPKFFSLL
jgi:hypothetical protein